MTNQDNFIYTHLSGVVSSALDLVGYNENTKKLFIRFAGGNEIVYLDVPKAEYDALVDSSSVGRYYNYNIQGEYKSDKQHNTRLRKSEAKAAPVGTTVATAIAKAVAVNNPTTVRFAVEWVDLDNVALSGRPEFQAIDEADALKQFGAAIDAASKVGFTPKVVKVKSITRYLD